MQQWRYRRVTSESLGCNLWLNDLEMLRWRGIASHMFRMPHGASTVWHAVLDLTGMRGVTYPRSLASPQWALTFASRSLWMCLLLRGWWWLILTVDTWDAVHFEAKAKSSWLHTRSWLSPRASGIQQCAFLLTMSPRLINARHAMGLPTHISTSKIADHSNALAENAVNRIRGLAWRGAGQDWDEAKHQQHYMELGSKACTVVAQQAPCSTWCNPLRVGPWQAISWCLGKVWWAHLRLLQDPPEGREEVAQSAGFGKDWGPGLLHCLWWDQGSFWQSLSGGLEEIRAWAWLTSRSSTAPHLTTKQASDHGLYLRREKQLHYLLFLTRFLWRALQWKQEDLEAEAVIKKATEENREDTEAQRMLSNDPKEGAFEAAPLEDGEEDPPKEKERGGTTSTAEASFSSTTSTLSTSPPQAMSTTKEKKGTEKKEDVL